ncbi:ROK family protein [Carboxylicivirga sp. M1479]|uniref:ROK family protein n=1 Tax=Carboxylicivirga sp. M1479 TaxID=2594476 RepID=UPI00117844AE|nr:ROK family protein [Carboxylicivirga sp. M1479]TRX66430.1 ROK family protein [Carboxylicivirga sp. M1479]
MNYAIGIDLGGTNIKYALVADDGTIVNEAIKPTQSSQGRDVVITNIIACAKELIQYAEINNLSLQGIGLGTPGIIDNGLVLGGAENLPEWESLPLGGLLKKQLSMPVFVENDANMMGLAEVRFGAADNVDDAVFLTIGTGVGGALVLNGKLYGGHRNRGAELGHIIINPQGEECDCGTNGCLEAHASVTSLIRDYKHFCNAEGRVFPEKVDGLHIVQMYKKGEKSAEQALNLHIDYLAKGIASFINVFSPQKVIVGGGLSDAGEFYITKVRNKALKLCMKETSIFTQVETANLGNKAGFIGAAALVFDRVKQMESQTAII